MKEGFRAFKNFTTGEGTFSRVHVLEDSAVKFEILKDVDAGAELIGKSRVSLGTGLSGALSWEMFVWLRPVGASLFIRGSCGILMRMRFW